MAVAADGSTSGTIGGGMVEFDLVNHAKALLAGQQAKPSLLTKLHHHAAEGDLSGMACGGEQVIAVYCCGSSERQLIRHLTVVDRGGGEELLQATAQGLSVIPNQNKLLGTRFEKTDATGWSYQESIGVRKTAYIIGGGHVALALSRVLATLDVDIVVLDERENLETLQRNAYATEKRIVNYCRIGDIIPEGEQVSILIMTHSHRTDELVVEKLAGKKINYIGVLGSKNKIAQMKRSLRSNGVAGAWLDGLHAPAGLPINSHTPAEIAISIAAELIQCTAKAAR